MRKIFTYAPIILLSLFTHNLQATTFAFCSGALAYSAEACLPSQRAPNLDYICQLKSEQDLGYAPGVRCAVPQKGECQLGAGGESLEAGDHNVPRNAWFRSYSTTVGHQVKCQCGCFEPNTYLLDDRYHYNPIGELLDLAKKTPVSIKVRNHLDKLGRFENSLPMVANHFVVGPEEKPMLRIITEDYHVVILTENHPILTLDEKNRQVMKRAHVIKVGDVLIDEDGEKQVVSKIILEESKTPRTVINLSVPGDNRVNGIIVANGLQVGDNNWQKILDERYQREKLRTKSDLSYLEKIIAEQR